MMWGPNAGLHGGASPLHTHCMMMETITINHLADAFIQSDLHRLIHTLTHRRQSQPCKATASSSGAVRVKCLAQGHIDTQLGGARDGTSNLSVNKTTALPPELRRPSGAKQRHGHANIYLQGIQQTPLSKATYNKSICQKKEKQQYISVGTVRMFIEPSAKH
ncbi:unnamed protein product [Arctogadus glacialis]